MTASSPQLPLALRYPPDQRLDTLVVDAPALTAQLRDFALAGVRRALYVAGPPGTGGRAARFASGASGAAARDSPGSQPST